MRLDPFRDFEHGETVSELGYDIVILRRNLGLLHMPTGELVACDPLNGIETSPFETTLEAGDYPVVLFVAELRDETVPAYAMLQIKESDPIRWERASIDEEDDDPLGSDDEGYPVDSSLGCFMDGATAKALMDYSHSVMPEDNEFRRALRGRVRRRLEHGCGWANLDLKTEANVPQVPDGFNVVAFDAGYGPGIYSTYMGRDADDELTRIVTDFEVLEFRFNTFPWGGGRHG